MGVVWVWKQRASVGGREACEETRSVGIGDGVGVGDGDGGGEGGFREDVD